MLLNSGTTTPQLRCVVVIYVSATQRRRDPMTSKHMDETHLLGQDACGIMRPGRGAVVAPGRGEAGETGGKWPGGACVRCRGIMRA